MIIKIKTTARQAAQHLAALGERIGTVSATLGPFTVALFPSRQIHQEPPKPPREGCPPQAPASCLRCGKPHVSPATR